MYLVGAGPGDPGLVTRRGASLLEKADAVVYDRLVNPSLLELAKKAKKIYVGKESERGKKSSDPRDRINRVLVGLAREGKEVVRLKGGDPFIFGRGAEEASYLRESGIRFEIVPGITAGYAAPAYAGIPVTDRRLASVAVFVTAHEGPGKKRAVDWKKLAGVDGTLVCFMAMKSLPAVVRQLKAAKDPKTLVSVIESGTLPKQRVVDGNLEDIAQKVKEAKIGSPALAVIGSVNLFRRKLAWFGRPAASHPKKRPLAGKKVLVTRAREQASSLKEDLERHGAEVVEFPLIRILPPADGAPLDCALARIQDFDWVLFTSPNGVRSVMSRLEKSGRDSRIFGGVKIGVIGTGTEKVLREKGLGADLLANPFTSKALVEKLKEAKEISRRKFLLPRTDIAPDDLPKALEALGGKVTQVVAYRTVPEKKRRGLADLIASQKIDFVTFTSSSTVKIFFEALPKKIRPRIQSRLISIGPVTTQELKHYGHQPYREAREHTPRGLVKAMINGR